MRPSPRPSAPAFGKGICYTSPSPLKVPCAVANPLYFRFQVDTAHTGVRPHTRREMTNGYIASSMEPDRSPQNNLASSLADTLTTRVAHTRKTVRPQTRLLSHLGARSSTEMRISASSHRSLKLGGRWDLSTHRPGWARPLVPSQQLVQAHVIVRWLWALPAPSGHHIEPTPCRCARQSHGIPIQVHLRTR